MRKPCDIELSFFYWNVDSKFTPDRLWLSVSFATVTKKHYTWDTSHQQVDYTQTSPGVGKHFLRRATLMILLLPRAACSYYIYYT